jgi:hypothetical protein
VRPNFLATVSCLKPFNSLIFLKELPILSRFILFVDRQHKVDISVTKQSYT